MEQLSGVKTYLLNVYKKIDQIILFLKFSRKFKIAKYLFVKKVV
jgi:hypothetical protein